MEKKHADHCFAIDGYSLFRRDRLGRHGGGVNDVMSADMWTYPSDSHELLWISVKTDRHMFLIGAVHHPPKPLFQPSLMLDDIEASIDAATGADSSASVILAGDLIRLMTLRSSQEMR